MKPHQNRTFQAKRQRAQPARIWLPTLRLWGLLFLALAVGGAFLLWRKPTPRGEGSQAAQLAKLDTAARQRDWSDVLRFGASMSNTTPGARLDIARALFHTGQLGDRLFSFPRKKDEPLIPDLRAGWEAYLPTSEAFLDLGLVNAAQHYACESLEIGGPGLWTLRQLSKVCLLKGQPAASRIFLKRLSSVPGHADWAAERLEAIESDPGNARCAELAALRPMCLTVDYPYQGLPIEDLLQKLLEANATNRMAFEFMMAHCLLSFQLDRFIRELPRFETLGYVRLPRHYEEALLLHQRNNPAAAQPLKRHTIARETQERFARFQKVISESGRPAHELESALAGEFGDTLWFYYAFGRTASASRSVPAS